MACKSKKWIQGNASVHIVYASWISTKGSLSCWNTNLVGRGPALVQQEGTRIRFEKQFPGGYQAINKLVLIVNLSPITCGVRKKWLKYDRPFKVYGSTPQWISKPSKYCIRDAIVWNSQSYLSCPVHFLMRWLPCCHFSQALVFQETHFFTSVK